MAVTQQELDALVQQIGDELLAQLGDSPLKSRLDEVSSCACGPLGKSSAAPAPRLDGWGDIDWTPPGKGIASLMDHTLLRPDATESEIMKLCSEADCHGFATVCVQPSWVARAVRELRASEVEVSTVIGFPHGATVTPVKCVEAEQVVKLGAREIDMVTNVGALKSGNRDLVYADIRSVVELAHQADVLVKVILENGSLNEDEKIAGSVLAKLAGADFVKTSTGFGSAGADPSDVALMSKVVGETMGVEAAGGIRSYAAMKAMMAAGATRIGSSSSVEILQQSSSPNRASGS